jgi:hypothetical protein
VETTMRIERSEVVDGEPGRLWSLLSSPAAWSLWPEPAFVFAVPDAPELRFFIGPTRAGTGKTLFEISDQIPGAMIRLRTVPTGRQEFTLSVATGRRGTAKASVRVKEVVPRHREIGFELKRRKDVKSWLSAVRAVIEGRARWPEADISTGLLAACTVRPRIDDAQTTSASVSVSADPASVWDAIASPDFARFLDPSSTIHSGYVPGTPREEPGEMQYFVDRRNGGQLTGSIVVVSEISRQHNVLTHPLGQVQFEQGYELAPESESGSTLLTVTFRWPLTKLTAAARSQMPTAAQTAVSGYKSAIETMLGAA